jgi:hypothetical protein
MNQSILAGNLHDVYIAGDNDHYEASNYEALLEASFFLI